MWRGYLLLLAGCGFGHRLAPDAGIPDGGTPANHTFALADLQAGQRADMTVDAPRAALTPNAYTYGGLIARGAQGQGLWQAVREASDT